MSLNPCPAVPVLIERSALAQLMRCLQTRGYEVVGPRVRDGAIVHERLDGPEDLPCGWMEEQEAGRYRLKRRDDEAVFGFTLGPQSWKKFLHPPDLCLLEAEREGSSFRILNNAPSPPKYALVGVRACELAAIRVQDRVLLGDRYVEPAYEARRNGVFLVAVQCTRAAPTCFCTSLNTGPRAEAGFDLALTELVERRAFVVEVGSPTGAGVLGEVEHREATPEERREAQEAVARVAGQVVRRLNTDGIVARLYENFASPRWDQIAARCLSCANCTMVCPTCFCTTVEDVTDVTGNHAERWRRWDSCFTESFSFIHGGSVRLSVKSRYRQWLTHKLASWMDQFGMLGCVGCGRCITWCPAKIDITEEAAVLRGDGS